MVESKLPMLAVRAIILREDGRMLLLKRASQDEYGDLWCLPGGKVDFGQTAEEAIARELVEETSLECKALEFLFYQDGLPQTEGGKHYLTLIFRCQTHGDVKLNEESSEYAWIRPEDLDRYEFAFNNDEAIKIYWSPHHTVN